MKTDCLADHYFIIWQDQHKYIALHKYFCVTTPLWHLPACLPECQFLVFSVWVVCVLVCLSVSLPSCPVSLHTCLSSITISIQEPALTISPCQTVIAIHSLLMCHASRSKCQFICLPACCLTPVLPVSWIPCLPASLASLLSPPASQLTGIPSATPTPGSVVCNFRHSFD